MCAFPEVASCVAREAKDGGMATFETIAVSLVTSLAGTFATMWFLQPRLEARKARILEAHAAREQFSASVLTVQGACGRLQNLRLDEQPQLSDVMRERLDAERERWLVQIDDATRWMVDNAASFGPGWPMELLRNLVSDYVGHARMVWISEREEMRRLAYLADLSAAVRDALFTHVWHRARHFAPSVQRLQELVAVLQAEGSEPAPAAAPVNGAAPVRPPSAP